jgi:hypothetical protein
MKECNENCPIYFKHRIAGIFEGDPGENKCPFYDFGSCLYTAVKEFHECDMKGEGDGDG